MRSLDRTTAAEDLRLSSILAASDRQHWRCHTRVDRFWGDPTLEERASGVVLPYSSTEKEGNVLTIGGASIQWETLIGNGVTTQGAATGYYSNANAYISVGDSSTGAADTQTELQAGTNRLRKAMDATYPLHTDTTGTAGSKSITFRSTFATGDANWAWAEWGIFNGPGTGGPPTTGARMLNRKVESLGTKTSAATWVLTITLSLA